MAANSRASMSDALTRLAQVQQEIATGKRIIVPSDDPSGANQVISLNNTLADVSQYVRNGDEAKTFLNMTDTTLNSVGELMRNAKVLALQAANGTNANPEARQTLSNQISLIKTQIVHLANTTVGNRSLFAGQKTDTQPFDPLDSTNTYKGDSGPIKVEINRGEYVAMNVTGGQIFPKLLNDLDTLSKNIAAGSQQTISETDLTNMDTGLSTILAARGQAGVTGSQVTSAQSRLSAATQEFAAIKSNLEDADITQTVVALQQAQNAYSASLASTAKIFQQSLMDYLK